MDNEEMLKLIQLLRQRVDLLEPAVLNVTPEFDVSAARLAVADAITPLSLMGEMLGLRVDVCHE